MNVIGLFVLFFGFAFFMVLSAVLGADLDPDEDTLLIIGYAALPVIWLAITGRIIGLF